MENFRTIVFFVLTFWESYFLKKVFLTYNNLFYLIRLSVKFGGSFDTR